LTAEKGSSGRTHLVYFQFAIAAHLIRQKSETAFEAFTTSFRQANKKGANGVEKATNNALRELVQSGMLTRAEAREINGVSFEAAQLEDNGTQYESPEMRRYDP